MKRTAHLIFNPVSGQGNAEMELSIIKSQLEPEFDLTVYETTPECDANDLAEKLVAEGVDLVIASGGDGTVNAAAAALMGTQIPMAIIPRGTANAAASALGIPNNIDEACQVAISGIVHAIDTAKCNGYPMVLLAGIGIEADIVERTTREAKDRLGMLAYVISGFQQLRNLERFTAKLETDDRVISVEATAVTVANVAPPTSILAQGPAEMDADDGLLDITIVAPDGVGSALTASYELLRSALSGEATQREDVGYLRSHSVTITTDPPQKIVLDGEIRGETPLEVVCVSKGLHILLPEHAVPSDPEKLDGLPGLSIESKLSSENQ